MKKIADQIRDIEKILIKYQGLSPNPKLIIDDEGELQPTRKSYYDPPDPPEIKKLENRLTELRIELEKQREAIFNSLPQNPVDNSLREAGLSLPSKRQQSRL